MSRLAYLDPLNRLLDHLNEEVCLDDPACLDRWGQTQSLSRLVLLGYLDRLIQMSHPKLQSQVSLQAHQGRLDQ